MEKLENEKVVIEQQNQFLLQCLAQMEAENNRLSQQVARLSAEIHGSSSSRVSDSPMLTATLFKQDDDIPLERVPFPTPSDSPIIQPSSLAESSDMTQHPAAVLCDLQCQSLDSKEKRAAFQAFNLMLQMMLQLLFLMMTSTAYSTVIHPLLQNLHSLKMDSSLTSSTEIYRPFPLILSLISTPKSQPNVLRTRLLTRLLVCSPALARPLRDATGKALQLAVNKHFSQFGHGRYNGVTRSSRSSGSETSDVYVDGRALGIMF